MTESERKQAAKEFAAYWKDKGYQKGESQPYLIEPKMTELLAINKERERTMHIIERIARFHLEFEGIHPFIDGNGRTGRLILNLD